MSAILPIQKPTTLGVLLDRAAEVQERRQIELRQLGMGRKRKPVRKAVRAAA